MSFTYLSIDCETTGLNPENCQVLSFAAVIEDTSKPEIAVEDLPYIHLIIRRDFIQGEPYALNMNKDLIDIINKGEDERLVEEEMVYHHLMDLLHNNDIDFTSSINVAGKNFSGFDKKFIMSLPRFRGGNIKFSHRVLDVGSVLVDFQNDEWIPDLEECKRRAGVKGVVTHDALEDARDVIRALRTKYNKKDNIEEQEWQ